MSLQPLISRIKTCDAKYMEGFHSELDAFIDRIETRAKEKTDKLMAEVNHFNFKNQLRNVRSKL